MLGGVFDHVIAVSGVGVATMTAVDDEHLAYTQTAASVVRASGAGRRWRR
jgi:hypothetical protein